MDYPLYRSSITFAPNLYINTRTGEIDDAIGFVRLDKNVVKLGEMVKLTAASTLITDSWKSIASSVEALGNIV